MHRSTPSTITDAQVEAVPRAERDCQLRSKATKVNARRVIAAAAVVAGVAAVTAGCSQVDSLKQASGVPINTLQIAVGTVLVNNKVPILVAPNCVEVNNDSTKFECKGKTTTGQNPRKPVPPGPRTTSHFHRVGPQRRFRTERLQLPMVVKVGGSDLRRSSPSSD